MKNLYAFLTSTIFVLLMALALNIAGVFLFVWSYNALYLLIIYFIVFIFALSYFIRCNMRAVIKLIFFLIILIAPLFGVVLFINYKIKRGTFKQRKKWQDIYYQSSGGLEQTVSALQEIKNLTNHEIKQTLFVLNSTNMPVYEDSAVTYINNSAAYYEELFKEIKLAKKFILLEYYIIRDGKVWTELFDILKLKASQGVEIKIIVDRKGSYNGFSDKQIFKKLANHGIETVVFRKHYNKFNSFINYRDHRKLAVIDGVTAFIGSINIADHHLNLSKEKTYWKDSAIKIEGNAVWNVAVMFFDMWNFIGKSKINAEKYHITSNLKIKNKEFTQPFGVSPFTREVLAREIYTNIINCAKQSVKIVCPYLVLDEITLSVLKNCAKSGINVEIIVPSASLKQFRLYLSRSNFSELIKNGVKIYTFTPGYVHTKMIICDNTSAVFGTMNFDFRNLYLHFQNAILIHRGNSIKGMIADFNSLLTQCHEVTLKDMKSRSVKEKVITAILKLFSPIL